MSTEMHKDLPVLEFTTKQDWLDWLETHGETSGAIWVKQAKKGSGMITATYEELREAAIMFGWIDGLINAYNDQYFLTRFSPRKPTSVWSKINRGIAEELIAKGAMRPEGLATVEVAKANGRWDAAYDSPSTMTVPDDLQEALDHDPKAKAFFATISKANRYAILYRIHTSHKPETRARQIQKLMAMLAAGKTIH